MMERRRLRRRRTGEVSLMCLHLVRSSVAVNSSHGSASYTCPRLVRRMVEQCSNVVNEQRI